VDVSGMHNQPRFKYNPDAVYSQLIYAAKAGDVAHVICNGRWLLRDRALLTIDEETTRQEAAQVAAQIDAFVAERESSPYNKLVFLAGVERQESFEVQIKVPIADDTAVRAALDSKALEIAKYAHYRQFDHYFYFSGTDQDAARLRYREDEFINDEGEVTQVRARLTLIGEEERAEFDHAIMLSRSRFLASADNSLRFYQEYFAPSAELAVNKDRYRWRIVYEGTDFAINLDQVTKPELPGYYLEIKSRTWSRKDADRKAALIVDLLKLLGVEPEDAERREYAHIVAETA
jgi:5-methylthioadenosine/S-adenosylhomocysteine deaminase